MRLRRMIEIDSRAPRHLLSIRGTGYRFVREPAEDDVRGGEPTDRVPESQA